MRPRVITVASFPAPFGGFVAVSSTTTEPLSINPSLDAHRATSAASAKSAAASFGFAAGTNPKYRKNGSFGHGPYEMVISAPASTPSSPARS